VIASVVNVALGAPCFLGTAGEGDSGALSGEFAGVVAGDGVAPEDIDFDGVSVASGAGEIFFFRRGEAFGDAEAEGFLVLVPCAGGSDSFSDDEVIFFLTEAVADGAGDSASAAGEDFLLGDGLGNGDVFFVLGKLFFFRGVGVGVGVEKIFLIAWPNDSSAACAGTTVEIINAIRIRARVNIVVLRSCRAA
jgi:hypothetical protein